MHSINTTELQVSAVKYFLMDLILMTFATAFFVFLFYVFLQVRVWSK